MLTSLSKSPAPDSGLSRSAETGDSPHGRSLSAGLGVTLGSLLAAVHLRPGRGDLPCPRWEQRRMLPVPSVVGRGAIWFPLPREAFLRPHAQFTPRVGFLVLWAGAWQEDMQRRREKSLFQRSGRRSTGSFPQAAKALQSVCVGWGCSLPARPF